ncbi:transglycosylase SLT domain-containing protein [Thermophagus xiamenensis]|uniref:Membrane-bound lytic murein transglycosylase F n=1 Tax=Thermophagus xiamenensis TaxID=385682 RepID=A0A1I2DIQ0_9BACT|nr:transporter substrate-binding domain-containing protein [Thermophagus xiamenensis]SFE80357.1 membrane-bound lytic murein transglycosylase F [Thermophagus xiamenensis]
MGKISTLIILVLLFCFTGCFTQKQGAEEEVSIPLVQRDLNEIKAEGLVRVVTNYNSTNYFVYKGKPMGYQLELLQEFANYTGLKLDISVNNDLSTNFSDLRSGKVDIIASNLAAFLNRQEGIAFTEPHSYSRQVLVQRKYSLDKEKGSKDGNRPLIRNQLDLAGKTVYVQKESAYVKRLRNLSQEIGDSINIVEIADYEVEQLIGLVASGEIEYTVCDENLARVNLNYYPNLDVETPISFPQKMSWAVRSNSYDLLSVINNWLIGFKKTARYTRIYQKYFLNKRSMHLVDEGFHSIKGGQVSDYDNIIKEESRKFDWDWRLIASIIYQESRFLPSAESWAGARGLMQLMPETANYFGVSNVENPRENIRAGVEFLRWLDERLKNRVPDPQERIKFVLASYNVGIGHVFDAMKLAEKYGKDPQKWEDNVDYYLLHKSEPKYYNDPVVKYGYCRGEEPYHYVTEILERYDHYKNVMQ